MLSENLPVVYCLVCGTVLQMEDTDRPVTRFEDGRLCHEVIYGGVGCVAHGNYGSTAWDPIHPENPVLGFVLCDKCFRGYRSRMVPVDDPRV